jgi:hypothetical protein
MRYRDGLDPDLRILVELAMYSDMDITWMFIVGTGRQLIEYVNYWELI